MALDRLVGFIFVLVVGLFLQRYWHHLWLKVFVALSPSTSWRKFLRSILPERVLGNRSTLTNGFKARNSANLVTNA